MSSHLTTGPVNSVQNTISRIHIISKNCYHFFVVRNACGYVNGRRLGHHLEQVFGPFGSDGRRGHAVLSRHTPVRRAEARFGLTAFVVKRMVRRTRSRSQLTESPLIVTARERHVVKTDAGICATGTKNELPERLFYQT